MDTAGRWGQIAVMLATAAGLFVSAQDTKNAVLELARAVERLNARVAVQDDRYERVARQLEKLEDRRR